MVNTIRPSDIFDNSPFMLWYIRFIISTIIFLLPPCQFFLTYLHELGHCLHLKIISIFFFKESTKSKIIINSKRRILFFYSGMTTNSKIYALLISGKHYTTIRIQAMFGSLTIIVISLIVFAILKENIIQVVYFLPILTFLFELANFFTSSDFTYFKDPTIFTIEKYLGTIKNFEK